MGNHKKYPITPMAKPRQTRSDVWKKRPCVLKYRDFADEVRRLKIDVPESGSEIIFNLPMPKSWSQKKTREMIYKPHKQTPDLDNLIKALLDALFKDDSHIYNYTASKYWDTLGSIVIRY